MTTAYPHVGDSGTILELAVFDQDGAPMQLGDAALREIVLVKPQGQVVTKPAVLSTDGTDGKIRCAVFDFDFDQPGEYQVQGHVRLSTGEWRTSVETIHVEPNLS